MNDSPGKILLVEDEPLLIDMYAGKFREDGFQVITAVEGDDALEKAQKELPKIILLDIMLPKINGLEILKKLKASAPTKKIPVVLLTNLAEVSIEKEALSLGASDFIVKIKTDPSEVVKKVKSIIAKAKS